MVGSVDAASSGHQVVIDFREDRMVFRFPDYRTANKLQSDIPLPQVQGTAKVLAGLNQSVYAKIGKRREIQIFPQPSWIVRLLSPAVRKFADAAKQA